MVEIEEEINLNKGKIFSLKTMFLKRFSVFIVSLAFFSRACSSSGFVSEEEHFPLEQSQILLIDENIHQIGTSSSNLVYATASGTRGVDADSFEPTWKVEHFSPSTGSQILFVDDFAVLMSYNKVLLVDDEGKTKFLNLSNKRENNIELVAVFGSYIYVIRGNWFLEVYDIQENKMIWETGVGRGGADIYYEPSLDIVYVVSHSSVRAFWNSTGEKLWEQSLSKDESAYQNGVLFIADTSLNSKTFSLTAIDLPEYKVMWSKEFSVDLNMSMKELDVFGETIILTTISDGLLAFDINSGDINWVSTTGDAYYVSPVLLDGVLYVKGSSKRVFAIAFDDGETLGYVKLEDTSLLGMSSYASGVYLYQDGIVFTTDNSIVFYSPEK